MKKLDLSAIQANVRGLILEDATLSHITNAYQEAIEALLLALGCDPAAITILSGAVVDGSADPDFTVTAGWAAYDGEIFQVDAGAFTAAGGETAVWVIEETFIASDPVKFDDGNEFNVNQIRKLKLQSGVAGSGVKDWGDVVDQEWHDFTLLNGAVDHPGATYPGGRGAPGYRKVGNIVFLRGAIEIGTDGHVATLPVGYRPSHAIVIPTGRTPAANAFGRILADGTIDGIDGTSILLDFISFPI